MRIISQRGTYDLPYEKCVVWRNKMIINVSPIGEPDSDYPVAIYSTVEKAERAMKMLQDKYESRMELDGGYDEVHGCYVPPNFWILPKIFRFPREEDIE